MNAQPYSEGGQGPGNSTNYPSVNSILVADCGAVFTKVSLFGLVEGQYRLMARGEAPTTIAAPHENITRGIIQAINVIEFITGRQFVAEGRIISPEQAIGDGVDVFITTISAGGPLRLAVLGAVSAELENLAQQSVAGLYAETHTLSSPSFIAATAAPVSVAAGVGGAGGSDSGQWTAEQVAAEWERQIAQIRQLQPQGALIVGMADGPAGPTPLQEACQLLVTAAQERNQQRGANISASKAGSPHYTSVIYAGAPQYVEAVSRMVSEAAEVTRVDSLVSATQLGPTSMAIGALYEREVIQQIPGYATLKRWSTSAPVATATSLSSLVRFLAQHYAMNVTAVDIGGATTTLMLAGEHGEFIPMVNPGAGVGPGLGAVLEQVGVQRIARWLPFTATEEELREYVLNHMAHPEVIPTTIRDLQISHAFAREALTLTVEMAKQRNFEWLDADLILATGGVLSHAPRYGQSALMLLDALQPRGVTSLVLDRTMLVPQLGAVATVAPVAAVQVNENDAVTHRLGTCVIPFGAIPQGQIAVRVGIEYRNGRQLTVDVIGGSIEVIPLRSNEQALLSLFPAPGVDVGLGPGERARAAEEIDGGLLGLIIDARGRPLALPTNERERQSRLQQWMQAIGAL
ncbi:MAG TPA: glutamate mutase L [Ktedonobacteraceae bacterium]|nr:glutamate mutase L [Ktedonobacteraceae bacterium]